MSDGTWWYIVSLQHHITTWYLVPSRLPVDFQVVYEYSHTGTGSRIAVVEANFCIWYRYCSCRHCLSLLLCWWSLLCMNEHQIDCLSYVRMYDWSRACSSNSANQKTHVLYKTTGREACKATFSAPCSLDWAILPSWHNADNAVFVNSPAPIRSSIFVLPCILFIIDAKIICQTAVCVSARATSTVY